MNRYARQEMVLKFGADGQAKLAAAHVLVVGAGGLAASVLPYLVGAGVGRITLVDADVVSLSNLHRQVLFREDQIGQPKARVAAHAMQALNSGVSVEPVEATLTSANAPALVAKANLVLDCADSFAASYILSDACLAAQKPLISASVLGFEGYVGGFCGTAPSLRAVFPDLPSRAATCATAGVMGPVVGTLGAMQAQMGLNALLELSPTPLGQVITVNLRDFRTSGFRFDGAPEPQDPLCFIAPADLCASDYVVDLRDTEEAPEPVTPEAARLTFDQFKSARPKPDHGQRAVLTCRSGLRAWHAARTLRTYWNGDISLIAMGDPALTPKGPRL